jgi:hypothetical protein
MAHADYHDWKFGAPLKTQWRGKQLPTSEGELMSVPFSFSGGLVAWPPPFMPIPSEEHWT